MISRDLPQAPPDVARPASSRRWGGVHLLAAAAVAAAGGWAAAAPYAISPPVELRSASRRSFALAQESSHHPGEHPEVVAIGDVTGDGRPDAVVASLDADNNGYAGPVFVYPQLADGRLGFPTAYAHGGPAATLAIVLVDLNQDALLDVVVGHDLGVSVLLADGAGGLAPAVVVADADARVLSAIDLDLDGQLDIVSLGFTRGASLLFGNGAGGFRSIAALAVTAEGYNDQEVEDVNHDGFRDLVVSSGASWSSQVSVFLHDGLGGLVYPPQQYTTGEGVDDRPLGLGLGDVTGDGRHDAVLSRRSTSPTHLWVFAQDPTGGLTGPTTIPSGDYPAAVEVTDLDGNGYEDVVVVHDGIGTVGVCLQGPGGLGPETQYRVSSENGSPPQSVAVGDVSSDGCQDVAIAHESQGLVILYGTGCTVIPLFADGFESSGTAAWSSTSP